MYIYDPNQVRVGCENIHVMSRDDTHELLNNVYRGAAQVCRV